MSEFLQAFKSFIFLIIDFFEAVWELLKFLWDMLTQLDDLIFMVTSASSNIPMVFSILPSCLYTFATTVLIVAILYLFLGRND